MSSEMEREAATRDSLIDQCLKVIDATRRQNAQVTLVVGPGRLPEGFPRGKVACVTLEQEESGHRVMFFPVMRVLRYALSLPNKEAGGE